MSDGPATTGETRTELFRTALTSALGDDGTAARLSLNSLLAVAQDDPELQAVVDETVPLCDQPITKRTAEWGQELLDHERAIRERIAADIEAYAQGFDGSAGLTSKILDPSLRTAVLACASIARSGGCS